MKMQTRGFMLAKAITGHKSQGLGLLALIIHCDENEILKPGWLFTTLTRLKTSLLDHSLKLRLISPPSFEMLCKLRRHFFFVDRRRFEEACLGFK